MITLIVNPELKTTQERPGKMVVVASTSNAVLKIRKGDTQLSLAFSEGAQGYHRSGTPVGMFHSVYVGEPISIEDTNDPTVTVGHEEDEYDLEILRDFHAKLGLLLGV